MRMTIFVLFLMILNFWGHAQKSDTVLRYFNSRFEPVQKNTAVYIGKSYPVNNKWGVQVMDDSSRMLMSGTYKDKSLKIKDGLFTFYYPSGKPSISGNFVSNDTIRFMDELVSFRTKERLDPFLSGCKTWLFVFLVRKWTNRIKWY